MILINLRRMFSLTPKPLSPPEKREYKEAVEEFTSEGAPPVTPHKTPGGSANPQPRSLQT